jgi:hypothetical protein
MAHIGKINTLIIESLCPQGAWLNAGQLGQVLLPQRYVPHDIAIGDPIDVFLYHDQANRLTATTEKPLAQVGEFALMQAVTINKMGAFVNWGIKKDLLVPFGEQKKPLQLNRRYIVRVYQDKYSDRIVGSTKLDKFLNQSPINYRENDPVNIIIAHKTDLGVKVIINHRHWGLIYHNEIFQPLSLGEQRTAYIKKIREDGNIDVRLSRTGKAKVNDFAPTLLSYLEQNNGYCALHDKSDPDAINQQFGVSKKTFKAAVGHLMKQGKIIQNDHGLTLKN